jgi:RNA polymerase sigma-70 factor (ECF subfamily)
MTLGHSFEIVLQAAKLGSEWAWATLYGEISGALVGFFRCRGIDDPESVAGDVFFALAREIQRFEGDEDSFWTLVFALAHRRFLSENESPNRRSLTGLSDRILQRLKGGAVAQPHVIDVPEEVRTALAQLSPGERDVISLRAIAGLSIDQVAEVLGIGAKAVRGLQRKGMSKVRVTLQRELAVA